MKSILFCFVLLFCLSFINCKMSKEETLRNLVVKPLEATNWGNVSAQCNLALTDLDDVSYNYTQALNAYTKNCTKTFMQDIENLLKNLNTSTTTVTLDIDCTTGTPYQPYQTQCSNMGGKWCTTAYNVQASHTTPKAEFTFDIKFFQCFPKNCSRTDISNLQKDFNEECDANDEDGFDDFSCSITIGCGSSVVIIIIIIIVIIVVLVVAAVVVVMVMRKRRSEYTPIKTGEYH